jgi:hypothetical protein
VSRLTFYRYALPMVLRNGWLRAQVWAVWYGGGLLRGRWPWETWRELREARRRIDAATAPTWKAIEDAVLGRAPSERRDWAP